jgi:uncharacterized protein (TIGR02996 family)
MLVRPAAAAIAAAAAAIEVGDPAAALAPLIAAWRDYRADVLARLVERVSELAATPRGNVPGATAKARLGAALELLTGGDAVDLPRVFRALGSIKIGEAQVLASALAKLPPDPRFLPLVIELLRAPPWGVSTSRKLWRIVFDALAAAGDPRAAATLRSIALRPIFKDAWAVAEMERTVARAIGKLTAIAPPVDAAIDRACGELARRLDAKTGSGDALLERIYAAPGDLALRAVYADWLQERGDPRGEFIALQLSGAAAGRRRQAELLAEHGVRWLGAIAAACTERVRFANGFASEVAIDVERAATCAGAAEWATVRAVWLGGRRRESVPSTLLGDPALRSLEFVGDVMLFDLAACPGAGIGLALYRGARSIDDVIAALEGRHLRELGLDTFRWPDPRRWRPLWAHASALERVRIQGPGSRWCAWIGEDGQLPASVRSLELSQDGGWTGWTLELERGDDGRFSRLAVWMRPKRKLVELVENVLDELPADALESVRVHLDGTRASKAELARLPAALARQTRLGSLEIDGVAVALPARAAPRVRDVRRVERAAAVVSARAALASAAAALPAKARAAVLALDLKEPASVRAVVATMARAAAPAWVDVAFALLAFEDVDDKPGKASLRAIRAAAIRVLVAHKPAGAGRRIVELLDAPRGPWLQLIEELTMIPEAELGTLFDWFEARRGKQPRADEVYYAIIAAAAAASPTARVRRDLRARLTRKLTRFHHYAYTEAIRQLDRR